MVGSFDFEGNLGGRGYYTFYSSAMKTLQTDFNHDIAFAVTTNPTEALRFDITELPSIRYNKLIQTKTQQKILDCFYGIPRLSTHSTLITPKTQ